MFKSQIISRSRAFTLALVFASLSQAQVPVANYSDSLTWQVRLSILEARIETLSFSIQNAVPKSSVDDLESEIDRLKQELKSLQAFSLTSAEDTENYVIHSDQLAARGGALFVPPVGNTPDNGELFASMPAPLEESGLEISGFMDAVFQYDKNLESENDFYLNQVEVDLSKRISNRAGATLGIVYGDAFEIGVAQIDYLIKPESEESASLLKSWNVAAGQFDAPFGEDVSSYASNTRKSVSVPEVVHDTHCLWNDVGVQSSLNFDPAVFDMWLVRGFPLISHSDSEEPVYHSNLAWGSRLNVSLNRALRLGGSSAFGWMPDGTPAMQIYGVHAFHTQGSWSTTAEAIALYEETPALTVDRRGAYLQTVRELGHFFALCRGDYMEGSDFELHRSLSLGGGTYLGSGLECRAEYKMNQISGNQVFCQMVATF
jgi:hypothetical protein